MASYCANRHSYQSKCNDGPCEPRIADTVSSDACGAVWLYCKNHILLGTYLLQTQFQAYASIKVTWLQLNPHQQSQKMLLRFSEANSEKPYLTCLISQHSFCYASLFFDVWEFLWADQLFCPNISYLLHMLNLLNFVALVYVCLSFSFFILRCDGWYMSGVVFSFDFRLSSFQSFQ